MSLKLGIRNASVSKDGVNRRERHMPFRHKKKGNGDPEGKKDCEIAKTQKGKKHKFNQVTHLQV